MLETTSSTESSTAPTGDQGAGFASLKDRLTACAWWNAAEADKADEFSCDRSKSKDERDYYRRRFHRLTIQADSLFVQAREVGGR